MPSFDAVATDQRCGVNGHTEIFDAHQIFHGFCGHWGIVVFPIHKVVQVEVAVDELSGEPAPGCSPERIVRPLHRGVTAGGTLGGGNLGSEENRHGGKCGESQAH